MATRRLPQRLEESGLWRDGALQRFDDDGGDVVGAGFDQTDGRFGVIERRDENAGTHGAGDAGTIRHRLRIVGRLGRRRSLLCVVMPAVPPTLEFENLLAARLCPRHSQGGEGRLCPR